MVIFKEAELSILDACEIDQHLRCGHGRSLMMLPGIDAVDGLSILDQFPDDRNNPGRCRYLLGILRAPVNRCPEAQLGTAEVSECATAARLRTDIPLVAISQRLRISDSR